jgi:hypothetical protein
MGSSPFQLICTKVRPRHFIQLVAALPMSSTQRIQARGLLSGEAWHVESGEGRIAHHRLDCLDLPALRQSAIHPRFRPGTLKAPARSAMRSIHEYLMPRPLTDHEENQFHRQLS